MSSFKNTLVICLCLVSIVTANPIHPIGGLNSLAAGGCQFPQESTSPFTTSQSNGKHCIPSTTHLNTARTLTLITPGPPGLRLTHFVKTAALVPCAIAAARFEDFYNIIALKIETGQLVNKAPSKYVTCSLWDFELSFYCDTMIVPLSFVQAFAIDMAEWSSKQFSGFYEATVRGEGPLTGLVFVVKMSLKGKGLLSDGIGV